MLFANLANGLDGLLEDGGVLAQEVEDATRVSKFSRIYVGVLGFDKLRPSGRLRIRESFVEGQKIVNGSV